MGYPVVYEPAIGVSPGPTPGARALMEWALLQDPAAFSLGIYNGRRVRGGRSWSLHAEGRAIDIGFPVHRPDGHPGGTALAQRLVDHHADLGVQQVIWAGRIWRNTRDASGWRRYSGTSSHHDHIHAELTRAASKTLTFDRIVEATEQETDDMALTPAQEQILFIEGLEQKYRYTGPNCRAPSPRDVSDWVDHWEAGTGDIGPRDTDQMLAACEWGLLSEPKRGQ